MEEFKGKKDLHELILLYDNLIEEIDLGQTELNNDTAQRLYNIYDAMTNVLKDNL